MYIGHGVLDNLKFELEMPLVPRMIKEDDGFVKRNPDIGELDKRVHHFGKQRDNDACEDMQADLQSMIPTVKMNELIRYLELES